MLKRRIILLRRLPRSGRIARGCELCSRDPRRLARPGRESFGAESIRGEQRRVRVGIAHRPSRSRRLAGDGQTAPGVTARPRMSAHEYSTGSIGLPALLDKSVTRHLSDEMPRDTHNRVGRLARHFPRGGDETFGL